jgi:hypothetical protein
LTTLGRPKLASPIVLSSVLLQVAERSARQGQANALLFSKRSFRPRWTIIWIGNRSNDTAAVSHNRIILAPRTGQIKTQERSVYRSNRKANVSSTNTGLHFSGLRRFFSCRLLPDVRSRLGSTETSLNQGFRSTWPLNLGFARPCPWPRSDQCDRGESDLDFTGQRRAGGDGTTDPTETAFFFAIEKRHLIAGRMSPTRAKGRRIST